MGHVEAFPRSCIVLCLRLIRTCMSKCLHLAKCDIGANSLARATNHQPAYLPSGWLKEEAFIVELEGARGAAQQEGIQRVVEVDLLHIGEAQQEKKFLPKNGTVYESAKNHQSVPSMH